MSEVPSKQNITPPEPEISKYYEGVATAFRYAKFIALFVAVLFVMFLLSFFRDEISIQNFQYMMKYITSEESSLITTQKIHYPTSDSKALDLFNGDFVSAGSGGITLYDTYGNTVLQVDNTFSNPFFSLSKKYALCYDLSGNSYVIFSTFAKLHSESLEYPISDAVITNSGNYAILTRNREYNSVINLYNSDYETVGKIYNNDYTFALDLTPKHVAYATVSASDSRYLTKFSITKINTDKESAVFGYYDEFPVCVKFINNNLILLTDKTLRFYNSKFELTCEYSLSQEAYNGYAVSDKYIMLYFGKNIIGSENEARFYSYDGNLILSHPISGKINSIDSDENKTVILTNNSVVRLDFDTKKSEVCNIESGATKVMLQSDATALVCYSNYAELIDFSSPVETNNLNITEG